MIRKILFGLTIFLFNNVFGQNLVKFQIDKLPENKNEDNSIYLAGSFNNWNPGDESFKFKKDMEGHYYLEAPIKKGEYEFKITRGSWEKGECKKDGSGLANRYLKIEKDTVLNLLVQAWSDEFIKAAKKSTAGKNVSIIDTAFYIPQLNRHRKIWIYLPENYSQSRKKYPVLYMHDGQNVFDELTAYSEEWGVDEAMDSLGKLVKESIVVAIDNGQSHRLNEYSPYDMEKYGKGEGDQYLAFLVKSLKPFIDNHYRTLSRKKKTIIAGSSMGGLISMYAILKYPKVFGAAGVFSPSFWIAPDLKNEIYKKGNAIRSKIYLYMGEAEGKEMVNSMNLFADELKDNTKSKILTVFKKDAKHNELYWRKEFPDFYKWVFRKN